VPIEVIGRFGVAECQGDRVVSLVEKPLPRTTESNLAIFGRYVVNEAVVAGLRDRDAEGEVELTYGFAAAVSEPPGVRAVVKLLAEGGSVPFIARYRKEQTGGLDEVLKKRTPPKDKRYLN